MKDRDPARVDDPYLIEKLAAELPGILLWMLEGLKRLLANNYQFTISERSRRNLEAAMEDGDNLSQFLLKNSGRYELTFTKHIEGKYRGFRGVCVRPAFAA